MPGCGERDNGIDVRQAQPLQTLACQRQLQHVLSEFPERAPALVHFQIVFKGTREDVHVTFDRTEDGGETRLEDELAA
jgi:hypothetical protein